MADMFTVFAPLRAEKKASAKQEKLQSRFVITKRDVAIIQAVYEYRVLSTYQVEALLFQPDHGQDHPTKSSRCWARLKVLSDNGYLTRVERAPLTGGGSTPYLYQLGNRSAELLASLQPDSVDPIDWHPRYNQLKPGSLTHLLANNDIRVAVTLAAEPPFQLATWLSERQLMERHRSDRFPLPSANGKTMQAAVEPDGYFLLQHGNYPYHCFVECDLGTVAGLRTSGRERDWRGKIRRYLGYYRSGLYAKRYGTHGMRVLTVTTSEKRLANLKAVTEAVGGKARFWFTTFAQLHPQTVLSGPIWQVAGRDGLHSLTRENAHKKAA